MKTFLVVISQMLLLRFIYFMQDSRSRNSIGDAYTPQPGKTALDTERYRTGKIVQRSGDFQNRQCKLCKGAGEFNI